jgi:CHAT domain-containing protein/tetratricopeptide (TPR) repeat protein
MNQPRKQILGSCLAASICLLSLVPEAANSAPTLNASHQNLIAQAQTNRKAEADRLLLQGIQQHKTSQFQAALQSWEQALKIYRGIKDGAGEATSLNNLGIVSDSLGKYQEAISYHQQSLAIYKAIGDRAGEAKSLNGLGNVSYSLGKYQEAIAYHQQSLAIKKAIGDRAGEANSLNNLGNVSYSLGKYQEAISYHQQSLAITKAIGDRAGEANSLGNLGNVNDSLGKYQEAITYNQQSLAIKKAIGDRAGEAISLNNLGNVSNSLGKYQEAISYHQQSLAITKAIGDRAGEASSLNNLGGVSNSLGKYQEAIAYYQQSLVIEKAIGDRAGEASSLGNLGNVSNSLGKQQEAIAYHQQSLAITKAIGDRAGEASSLGNLGNVSYSLGKYQEALAYYQQSLPIFKAIGDRAGEANSLNSLGNVSYSLGKYQEAIAYYQQSLAIRKAIGDRASEATSLNNLGNALLKSGKLLAAEKTLRQGVESLELLRQKLTDSNKVSIFEEQARTYRSLQKVLIAQNKPNEALEIAERGRARALVDLLSQKLSPSQVSIANIPSLSEIKQIASQQNATLVEYSIIYDDFQIAGREETKQSKLYIWVVQPSGAITFRSVDLKPLWQDTETITPTTTPFSLPEIPEAWLFPLVAVTFMGCMAGVVGIFFTLLKTKGAKVNHSKLAAWMLLFVASASSTGGIIWSSRENQTRSAAQEASWQQPQTPLGKLVVDSLNSPGKTRGLYEVVTGEDDRKFKERMQHLHQLLIEPIADLLPSDSQGKVIFIPQGELFLVPFAALPDAQGKYLIEKFAIATAPSIQVLALTHQQRLKIAQMGRSPLTPLKKGGKEEETAFKKEGKEREKEKFENEGKELAGGALVAGNPIMPKIISDPGTEAKQLDPLPAAEKEAENIARWLHTKAIIGKDATESHIVSLMPKARFIHLATHGLLNDFSNGEIPGAIALAPDAGYSPAFPGSGIDARDGLLTAREILQLQLQAELVVLSACDTGKGKITGDGIVGLSRALFAAGVPTVIVSLWKVDDEATAYLMAEFYQQLAQQPTKIAALRQAILATKQRYPYPGNWGAFTLIGEGL